MHGKETKPGGTGIIS